MPCETKSTPPIPRRIRTPDTLRNPTGERPSSNAFVTSYYGGSAVKDNDFLSDLFPFVFQIAMDNASFGPYSTRDVHKLVRYGINRKDGSRVIDKPSFISFGTKEKPEPYKGGKVATSPSPLSPSSEVLQLSHDHFCRWSCPIGGSTNCGNLPDTRRTRVRASLAGRRSRGRRRMRLTSPSNTPAGRRR